MWPMFPMSGPTLASCCGLLMLAKSGPVRFRMPGISQACRVRLLDHACGLLGRCSAPFQIPQMRPRLDETLRNFLWVPLTAYAKDIGTSASLLGAVFGINVGVRFFPNLLVTMFGVKVEFPLMLTVFAGFVVAGRWQSETWSLFVLAACAGVR